MKIKALLKRVQIYLCHKFSGQRLKEIGLHFGIGVSGVSQTSRRVALQIKDDKRLKKKITFWGCHPGHILKTIAI